MRWFSSRALHKPHQEGLDTDMRKGGRPDFKDVVTMITTALAKMERYTPKDGYESEDHYADAA
eukprot:5893167-Pyramimonas_sp.AAC.1